MRALTLAVLVFAVSAPAARPTPAEPARAPHPWHTSLAQVELNEETLSLEVALRVDPLDLETALTHRAGERVDLDDEGVDEHIVAWLRAAFGLRLADGTRPPLEWVGKELFVSTAWLYFEIPLPADAETTGATLTDRLFLELRDTQRNTVNYRRGRQKASLAFTADRTAIELPF